MIRVLGGRGIVPKDRSGKRKDTSLNSVLSVEQKLSFYLTYRDKMRSEQEIKKRLQRYESDSDNWFWTAEILLLKWVLGEDNE